MSAATPLQQLLAFYRAAAVTERETGAYFEQLIRTYLRHEPTYADLYSDVWLLGEVPDEYGIDLAARGAPASFTPSNASSMRKTTAFKRWDENAKAALFNQQPPVSRIDLHDLEASQIDWSKYQADAPPALKPKHEPRPHQQAAIKNVVSGLKHEDCGKQLHVITFSESVELGMLTDYKVIVLTTDEDQVSEWPQDLFKDDNVPRTIRYWDQILSKWQTHTSSDFPQPAELH
jgi:predicted helicase